MILAASAAAADSVRQLRDNPERVPMDRSPGCRVETPDGAQTVGTTDLGNSDPALE